MGRSDKNESDNLNEEEICLIHRLMGADHICLSRGIGQLAISRTYFLSERFSSSRNPAMTDQSNIQPLKPSLEDWKIILKVGVLVISRHRESREHFIQAIDMVNGKIVLNHKVDPNTDFKRRRSFIVTFETKLGTFCLNFVDDDEADHFINILSKV